MMTIFVRWLSGLAGRDALRGMQARLQPKEEVMLMGWGVPTARCSVRSRRYDEKFWAETAGQEADRAQVGGSGNEGDGLLGDG